MTKASTANVVFADGVYLGLDEDAYHKDPALGSSDIRRLRKGPHEYWWGSWMNPKRSPEDPSDSQKVGTAMHKLLLEGLNEFHRIYVRGPWSELTHADLTGPEKGQLTKAAKTKLLSHQELIHADEYDLILAAREVIDRDPELTGCLDNGPSEVSVFWTRKDGMRLKCRFDKLKMRGYGDLKSIANQYGDELGLACRRAIGKYRYDMQIEHYNEGRSMLPSLVNDEKIFFSTVHVKEAFKEAKGNNALLNSMEAAQAFLANVATQREFGAQIVFVPKTGAPDAWSTTISPMNPLLRKSRDDIETSLMIYRDAMKKYGEKGRWLSGRIVSELAVEELPYELSKEAP